MLLALVGTVRKDEEAVQEKVRSSLQAKQGSVAAEKAPTFLGGSRDFVAADTVVFNPDMRVIGLLRTEDSSTVNVLSRTPHRPEETKCLPREREWDLHNQAGADMSLKSHSLSPLPYHILRE